MQKLNIKDFLYSIPKTEIHLHLEGLASVDTIWSLKLKHNLNLPGINTKEDLVSRFKVKTLDEFISLFINVIQTCFKENNDLMFLIKDAANYFKRNNIVYAEIFFAPTKFLQNGLDFSEMMTILDNGSVEIERVSGTKVNFLIDVSRGFGYNNARNNLDLLLKNRKKSVIGIGLGGAESKGRAKDFAEVFRDAKNAGLKIVAHAGEDVGPESIWEAINELKVSRIGHGISAYLDQSLIDYLVKYQIPLEICPTSNLFTQKYASTIEQHPVKDFYKKGIFVTINTDDPTIFGTELIDEYYMLMDKNIFSLDDIVNLIKNNVKASFLSEQEKTALLNQINKTCKY